MSMLCPRCGTSHEQRYRCPGCGGPLIHPGIRGRGLLPDPSSRWQQTALGRIAVGLMLSQGLFHGFRQLATGVLLAVNREGGLGQTTSTPEGFVTLQILQIIAVVLGGMLAGSGHRSGLLLGAVVGLFNGLICAVLQFGPPRGMSPLILYGHPVVHVVCGALGGWLGYLVWKPVSEPAQTESKVIAGKAKLARRRAALFGGRVAWFRVTIGVAIALAGCLSATYVRNAILDVTTGRLATTDFQDYVITWELKALAVLLGGVAAGINTRNGPKQGLCVGLAVAALLVGYETHGVTRFVEVSGLLAGGSVALCLAGGWFGSTLFPPVVKVQRIPIGAGV